VNIPQKNNFDHLRLFLAIGVFLFHTAELTQLQSFAFIKNYISPAVAVHSFFIISGFLIFMSYERSSSLKSYFTKRLKRIAPAYIVVVLILFITLSLLSTLPLQSYFTSVDSYTYLLANLSTLNFLHPTLPGVFSDHHLATVDGSLWTIKVEVAFYLSVPLIAYGYRWFKPTPLLITIFILSSLYVSLMGYLAVTYHQSIFSTLQYQFPGQLLFFSAGALLYYQHNLFQRYAHLLLIVGVSGFILNKYVDVYPLYALSLSLIVIYLATAIKQLGHIGKYGDFSYGIYIWHFPLVQLFIALSLFDTQPWLAFGALTLSVFAVAWISWHLIEKPFLNKKSHYVKEEKEQF